MTVIKTDKEARGTSHEQNVDIKARNVPNLSDAEKRRIQLEIIQQGRRRPSSGK